jgi:hypothetical protein
VVTNVDLFLNEGAVEFFVAYRGIWTSTGLMI